MATLQFSSLAKGPKTNLASCARNASPARGTQRSPTRPKASQMMPYIMLRVFLFFSFICFSFFGFSGGGGGRIHTELPLLFLPHLPSGGELAGSPTGFGSGLAGSLVPRRLRGSTSWWSAPCQKPWRSAAKPCAGTPSKREEGEKDHMAGSKQKYHFGVGAPLILEPILEGIGMFTGGFCPMTTWLNPEEQGG